MLSSPYIPQHLYNEILTYMPIPCVDVAIVTNGALLLVMRKDAPAKGEWWIPGGRVIKGELMRDTAERKTREEVGIDCDIGAIVYTAETIFTNGPSGIPVHTINSCFLAYPTDPNFEPTVDDHHSGYKWIKTIPKGLHPYVERCLIEAGLEAE